MKFLKAEEVAERLQCSKTTVMEMVACGKIPVVRLGRSDKGDIRVSEAALWELGVGGPRPVLILTDSLDSVSDFVSTPTVRGRSLPVADQGLGGRRRNE
jgi:excisionase family DNA binding protein